MNRFAQTQFLADGTTSALSVIIGADATSSTTGFWRDTASESLVCQIYGISSLKIGAESLTGLSASDTTSDTYTLSFSTSRGTLASPTATTANKVLGVIEAKGYIAGSGFVAGGQMKFWQNATAGTQVPTSCSIYLSDTTSTDKEVVRFSGDSVGGTTTIYGTLNHNGSLIKFFNGTARTRQPVAWEGLSDSSRLENLKDAFVTLNLIHTDET